MSKRKSSPQTAPKGPKITTHKDASKGHVLVIMAVGFGIGVLWPRLAGVSFVPEAPIETEEQSDEEVAAEGAEGVPTQDPEVIELTPEDRLKISPPQITSCETGKDKSTTCDTLAVDELVHSHLISLLGCPSAVGVFGTLSLGFKLDFEKGKVVDIESGRSTDLPETTTTELIRCAQTDFDSIALNGVPHKHDRYQVYYLLEFKTPEAAAEEKTSVTAASGKATVQWRTALIREEADREGKVVARLLSGAVVIVTGRMGEWYRVKYDEKGREGWVHGAAIGLKAE